MLAGWEKFLAVGSSFKTRLRSREHSPEPSPQNTQTSKNYRVTAERPPPNPLDASSRSEIVAMELLEVAPGPANRVSEPDPPELETDIMKKNPASWFYRDSARSSRTTTIPLPSLGGFEIIWRNTICATPGNRQLEGC